MNERFEGKYYCDKQILKCYLFMSQNYIKKVFWKAILETTIKLDATIVRMLNMKHFSPSKWIPFPFWKNLIVGYPVTWYSSTSSLLIVPSTLASLTSTLSSLSFAAALAYSGARFLQWPHHGAVKATRIFGYCWRAPSKFSLCRTRIPSSS